MKNRCTIIHISGLQGFLIVSFLLLCLVAGFVIFPAWCCQHAWNYIAGFVAGMPLMQLKHGAMLWLILVLIAYATMFGKFKVAFVPDNSDMNNFEDIRLLQRMNSDIVNDTEKEEINNK